MTEFEVINCRLSKVSLDKLNDIKQELENQQKSYGVHYDEVTRTQALRFAIDLAHKQIKS